VVETVAGKGIQRYSDVLPVIVAWVSHRAPSQVCTVKSVGTPSTSDANPVPRNAIATDPVDSANSVR
jgi:hypothetical protein